MAERMDMKLHTMNEHRLLNFPKLHYFRSAGAQVGAINIFPFLTGSLPEDQGPLDLMKRLLFWIEGKRTGFLRLLLPKLRTHLTHFSGIELFLWKMVFENLTQNQVKAELFCIMMKKGARVPDFIGHINVHTKFKYIKFSSFMRTHLKTDLMFNHWLIKNIHFYDKLC